MSKLSNAKNTIAVVSQHDFDFRKRFGQNFLVDEGVILRALEAAGVDKDDVIFEIGPGIGTLTQYLCEAAYQVAAIEIDRKLIPILEETLQQYDNVRIINQDVLKTDLLGLAREYEAAGADCISCLTEPKWFLGSDQIFREIRSEVNTPMIRKDFTVSEYQIYQAKAMGANAVLLICAILGQKDLENGLRLCDELGLAALTETHNEAEITMAVKAGAKVIGVNNRNLKDFSVDFSNAERLRDRIPSDCIYVVESGVKMPADARILKKIGADAALIGEALMRSDDKTAMLKALREAAK